MLVTTDRPVHAPTPVNPGDTWESVHVQDSEGDGVLIDVPYLAMSQKRIQEKLDNHWSGEMVTFIESGLYSEHALRCTYNDGKVLDAEADAISQELFARAENGSATPIQLIHLLDRERYLGDTEIAKQTHPFENDATEVMDKSIRDSILTCDPNALFHSGQLLEDRIETELCSYSEDLNAITIARKHLFATLNMPGGVTHIYRRRFRVLSMHAPDAPADLKDAVPHLRELYAHLSIKNNSGRPRLLRELEHLAADLGQAINGIADQETEWAQRLTSSYFGLTHERAVAMTKKEIKARELDGLPPKSVHVLLPSTDQPKPVLAA